MAKGRIVCLIEKPLPVIVAQKARGGAPDAFGPYEVAGY
jgi:hypothetical protein